MALEYIGALPDGKWTVVLSHLLSRADTFLVHMPDGTGPLSTGREAFEALPGVTMQPWSGMSGAVQLAGPLTVEARAAFIAAEPSLELLDPTRKLWDYRLLLKAQVLLSVSDFTDLMIAESELDALRVRGLLAAPFDRAEHPGGAAPGRAQPS